MALKFIYTAGGVALIDLDAPNTQDIELAEVSETEELTGRYGMVKSCGCVQVIDVSVWLTVIDSQLLPLTDIQILGFSIDGTYYEVNETFASREEILSYLIVTFVTITFRLNDNYIEFESSEVNEIEVHMVYQNYLRVFKVGNPYEDINVNVTAEFENGEEIVDDSLGDEVLSVHVGNGPVMPFNTQGYTHSPEDKTLNFGSDLVIADSYVFVITKQVPA